MTTKHSNLPTTTTTAATITPTTTGPLRVAEAADETLLGGTSPLIGQICLHQLRRTSAVYGVEPEPPPASKLRLNLLEFLPFSVKHFCQRILKKKKKCESKECWWEDAYCSCSSSSVQRLVMIHEGAELRLSIRMCGGVMRTLFIMRPHNKEAPLKLRKPISAHSWHACRAEFTRLVLY